MPIEPKINSLVRFKPEYREAAKVSWESGLVISRPYLSTFSQILPSGQYTEEVYAVDLMVEGIIIKKIRCDYLEIFERN